MHLQEFNKSQYQQLYKTGFFASVLIVVLAYAIYQDDPNTFSSFYKILPLYCVGLISLLRFIYAIPVLFKFNFDSILYHPKVKFFYLAINAVNALLWGLITVIITATKGLNSTQTMTSFILIVGIAASASIVFATINWLPTIFIFSLISTPSLYLIFYETQGTGLYIGLSGLATCFFFHFNSQIFYKYYTQSFANEEKLKQQSFFLKRLLDSIPGFVSYVDENGVYQLANQPLLDKMKLTHDQFVGKAFGFYKENKQFVEFISEFRNKKSVSHNKQIPSSDGSFLFVTASFVSEKNDFLILTFDVSHQVKMEKEIEDQNRKLEHAARLTEIGEVDAGIAHEINNAIFTVSLINQDIVKKFNHKELTDDFLSKKTTNIDKLLKRMQKIVLSLKTLSRKSNENEPKTLHDIQALVQDAVDLVEYKVTKKHIQIENSVQNINLFCLPTEITQIIMNLLNNAIDALETTTSPKIAITTETFVDDSSLQIVKILITDNGPGIPAEIQNKIMDSFYTTKEAGKGTGLGLSISQKIALKHQGQLYINKDYSTGAQFILELPLNLAQNKNEKAS